MFDRMDIVEAHAIFSHEFHQGQGSELYSRLSRCNRILTSSAYRWERLTINGREIYDALCSRFNRVNPHEETRYEGGA